MRARPQLGTIRLTPAHQGEHAYKGYLIRPDPLHGCCHVSKHGHHITTRDTLEQARADVDLLTV